MSRFVADQACYNQSGAAVDLDTQVFEIDSSIARRRDPALDAELREPRGSEHRRRELRVRQYDIVARPPRY